MIAEYGSVDAAPGVESPATLTERARAAFREIVDQTSAGPLVLVSHDAFNRALLGSLDQAFQYIQEFSGFVTPGITVIFLTGLCFAALGLIMTGLWWTVLNYKMALEDEALSERRASRRLIRHAARRAGQARRARLDSKPGCAKASATMVRSACPSGRQRAAITPSR